MQVAYTSDQLDLLALSLLLMFDHSEPDNVFMSNAVQVTYTSDQLDLLALGFTAAKALYVGGALARAAK